MNEACSKLNTANEPNESKEWIMAEETQTLEQTLEKTDLGHFVNTNKNSIIIAGVVLLVAIAGFSFYKHNADMSYQKSLEAVYKFEKKKIAAFLALKEIKSTDVDDAIATLKNAPVEVVKNPNFISVLFDVTGKIEKENSLAKIIPVYEAVIKNYRPKEYAYFFIALKLAVLYEDNQKVDEAIKLLESVVAANHSVLQSKVYLDLGRLYKQKGMVDKAHANFEYIIKNDANSEYAKLARLFEMQLNNL